MDLICPNCFKSKGNDTQCPFCGYVDDKTEKNGCVLPAMTILNNRYKVGRTLGIGGFGITYVAFDILTSELCAIKEFMPSQIAYREGMQLFPVSRKEEKTYSHCKEGFLTEATILKNVSRDPSVVKVKDFFRENNTAYIVMELLQGETLGALARKTGGKVDVKTATEMLLIIGSALMSVHDKGILHRDISPENIYHTKNGEYKLIDFGASRYYISEKSQSLSVYLKPGFAPPEQYSSKGNQGPWTDVYGLAATYYYILTGKKITDTMDRLAGEKYDSLKDVLPGFSVKNSNVIDKALALNYKERYQSVSDFLNDMDLSFVLTVTNSEPKKTKKIDVEKQEQKKKRFFFGKKKASNNHHSHNSDNKIVVEYHSYCELRRSFNVLASNCILSIGRSANCNIVTENFEEISREHCLLKIEDGTRFAVKDVSSNGTFINGQRVSSDCFQEFFIEQKIELVDEHNYIILKGIGK